MHRKTWRNAAVSMALAAVLSFGMAAPSYAAESDVATPQGGPIPCGTIESVSNVTSISNSTTWPNSSSWRVDGQGPGTLSISRALTSTNSVTGSGGVSLSKISASVGFNVSSSTTVTTSFSVTLASGETRQIQVGQVWARKSFSWKKSAGCAGNMTTTTGTGIAKKFLRYSYRSVKI